ncbi:MAG: hypothetical protein ACK56I_15725, partial [bacterium]
GRPARAFGPVGGERREPRRTADRPCRGDGADQARPAVHGGVPPRPRSGHGRDRRAHRRPERLRVPHRGWLWLRDHAAGGRLTDPENVRIAFTPSRPPLPTGPTPIGRLMSRLMARTGYDRQLATQGLAEAWRQAVSGPLRDASRPGL